MVARSARWGEGAPEKTIAAAVLFRFIVSLVFIYNGRAGSWGKVMARG